MNTAFINHILTATILGLIITSSANASSCPSVDKNIAEIQKNTALVVDVIEKSSAGKAQGGFQKVSFQPEANLPKGLIQVDEQSHPSLEVLASDGIISSSVLTQKSQLAEKYLGRVVMVNKCFAFTAKHVVNDLADEQKTELSEGQTFFGSFGRSCDKGAGDFKVGGVEMSVFAWDKLKQKKYGWTVMKISQNQKSKIQNFKFAKMHTKEIQLGADLLIGGIDGDNLKKDIRYAGLHAVKFEGGNPSESIRTSGTGGTEGKSGGGVYLPKDGKIVLAGIHVNQGFAIPVLKVIHSLILQDEAKAKELYDSFKDPSCY